MRYFGQEQFLAAQASPAITNPTCTKARQKATSTARKAINGTLHKFNLDAIIAPTNSPAWTTDLINGDHFSIGSSSPSAISGYPSISVPAGYSFGLPVGMSLIAVEVVRAEVDLTRLLVGAGHPRAPPTAVPALDAVGVCRT